MAETTQSDSEKGIGSVTMLTTRKVEKVSSEQLLMKLIIKIICSMDILLCDTYKNFCTILFGS